MEHDPDSAVVIITAHGAVSIAVEALKRGASDFVAKPWSNERLAATVRSAAALRRSKIDARVERGRASELAPASETPLLGNSPAMERVRTLIERAAPTDANVLILGENGTGKEIVAREIHRLSRRSDQPMVSIDLGATSETLFESELFGHVKGAFTGAAGERIGRLKAADHSTLFLDEVGNLPLHLQPKLLTALEQREVVPGRRQPAGPDRRPGRRCDQHVGRAAGRRNALSPGPAVPAQHDRNPSCRRCASGATTSRCCSTIISASTRASTTGPEREHPARGARRAGPARLAGQCPRAAPCRRAGGDHGRWRPLSDRGFPAASRGRSAPVVARRCDDSLNLDQLEKQMIERALRMHHFNISLAAAELGLSRGALYRRMEKHGL